MTSITPMDNGYIITVDNPTPKELDLINQFRILMNNAAAIRDKKVWGRFKKNPPLDIPDENPSKFEMAERVRQQFSKSPSSDGFKTVKDEELPPEWREKKPIDLEIGDFL